MRRHRRPTEALGAWLVTGPVGHLCGGIADWVELLARYARGRVRERRVTRARTPTGDRARP